MLKVFNTLGRELQEFKPLERNEVKMYICGPTVYNYAHLGNLRTYIFEDIVRRTLEMADFKVREVMNITDVDDKTIKKSRGVRESLKELTQKYEKEFLGDIRSLNIELPDKLTRATDYIKAMTQFVNDLLEKKIAYRANDGSIYFSIAKFKNYGKLSGFDKQELKVGARVKQDEYTKNNPGDFVLWKKWDEDDGNIFWEPEKWLGENTQLSKGRPGWHIECSTMSQANFGDTFDIHLGGVDLIFPHHENEIAQSEARSGRPLANYWLHSEHLLVENKKMSKSAHNFYTLAGLKKRGFSALDFRYFCFLGHFKSKLNFTWQALKSARDARERLKNIFNSLEKDEDISSKNELAPYLEILFNNFDTPRLLAKIWQILRDSKINEKKKYAVLKYFEDNLFKFGLSEGNLEIPQKIKDLSKERQEARIKGNYKKADEIRVEIENLGFIIEDTKEGVKIVAKSK